MNKLKLNEIFYGRKVRLNGMASGKLEVISNLLRIKKASEKLEIKKLRLIFNIKANLN